jgi:hypothetical protein
MQRLENVFIPDEVRERLGEISGHWHFLEEARLSARAHMIPVAIAYAGLGLYHVLEFVPQRNGYFVHIDGGSNDYDRADHAKHWNAYLPEENEILRSSLDNILLNTP